MQAFLVLEQKWQGAMTTDARLQLERKALRDLFEMTMATLIVHANLRRGDRH